jgi:predicted NAD/FAD-dependent oxidoreductase
LVDTGVQYFSSRTQEFKKELLTQLFHFRPIVPPILDRDGAVIPNTGNPRFYTLQGNNFLGHVFSTNLPMELHSTVESVNKVDDGYEVQGRTFAGVVSCAPWPQTAKFFGLPVEGGAEYEPCLTALIEYAGFRIGTAKKAYASIDVANKSIIKWSACENHKAGRIVGEKTVFVVHASPEFSREHIDSPPEVYLPFLSEENERIWKITDSRRSAITGHLWRFSRSTNSSSATYNLPPGQFICGDSRTDSEVEKVWLDGRKAAAEVLAYLCTL